MLTLKFSYFTRRLSSFKKQVNVRWLLTFKHNLQSLVDMTQPHKNINSRIQQFNVLVFSSPASFKQGVKQGGNVETSSNYNKYLKFLDLLYFSIERLPQDHHTKRNF